MELPRWSKKDINTNSVLERYALLILRDMSGLPLLEMGLTITDGDFLNINALDLHSCHKVDWLLSSFNFNGAIDQKKPLAEVIVNGDDFNHQGIWTARGLFAGLLSPEQQKEAEASWLGWGKWLKRKKLGWGYLFDGPDSDLDNGYAKQQAWFTSRLPIRKGVQISTPKDNEHIRACVLMDKPAICWVNTELPMGAIKVALVPEGDTLLIYPYLFDISGLEQIIKSAVLTTLGVAALPVRIKYLPQVKQLRSLLQA